jgi:hypothetical protein
MFNFKEMAVSEDVQNCADEESMEEWDSQRIQRNLERDAELLVFMKVQTINRMLSVGMLIKKKQ